MSTISSSSNSYMNYASMTQGVQGHGHHHKGGQAQQPPSASEITDSFFSQLDTAKQGYIDQSQLSSAMGGDSNSDASSKLFSTLDSDSDGKLTKEEMIASLEKQFASARDQFETRMAVQNATNGQGEQNGQMPPPPPGGMGGMMPPPSASNEEEDDEGYTAEELTALSESEETDSKRASLMSTIAANFDAADTDGNGKVTRSEAMAYEKAQKQATASSASSTTSSSSSLSTTTSSTADSSSLKLQLAAMMRLYNITAGNSISNSSNLQLSA